jgi:hypothetical protein
MKHVFLIGALAAVLAGTATTSPQAQEKQEKDEPMVTLSGCVQGFAQGGYFLSDSTDKKGKPKNYLLINDNDEVKEHTGKWVEVVGRPAEFNYGVSMTTADNRTLKAGSVFGVDTVTVIRETCAGPANAADPPQDGPQQASQ